MQPAQSETMTNRCTCMDPKSERELRRLYYRVARANGESMFRSWRLARRVAKGDWARRSNAS